MAIKTDPNFEEIVIQIKRNTAAEVYSAVEQTYPIPQVSLDPIWGGVKPEYNSIDWLTIKVKEFLVRVLNDGFSAQEKPEVSVEDLHKFLFVKSKR